MRDSVGARTRLAPAVGRAGYFALAFGAVVGSGWVIVLGDWFNSAGPVGTALGFLGGGLTMALVAACYGELAARFPNAGGELLYARAAFGRRAGFLVGWFLTLFAISTCAFEAVAFGVLLRTLVPAVRLPRAYQLMDWPVSWDALAFGLIATVAIAAVHWRGARSVIRVQSAITYGFITVIGIVIVVGLASGQRANLEPAFAASPLLGIAGIFAISVFFLNGWQVALHAIEERAAGTEVHSAVLSMIAGILTATLFYAAIALAAGSLVPWRSIVAEELPAAAAFRALGGAALVQLIVATALISLVKTWTAIAWMASRMLVSQARDGVLPAAFARLDPATGAPRVAIAFTTVATAIGVAVGRGALMPIVNMSSLCLALSILVCLVALLLLRRSQPLAAGFRVPTGLLVAALVCAFTMIGAAVLAPILRDPGRLPGEWLLLVAWGALGVALSGRALRQPVSGCKSGT